MATFESQYSLSSPWAEMWQNPEADAVVLLSMLVSKYGEEALDWDPVTIRLEIQDDFHVAVADEAMNKICAMQIVMASSDFFERVDAFANVCNALAEGDPFFEVFTPLEPEEIALALATVAIARDMKPFSPSIRRYVKEVLKAEGFSEDDFPPIFSSVFDRQPSSKDVRHELSGIILETASETAADANRRNISNMLKEHVGNMFTQLDKLPGLTDLDSHILEDGLLNVIGETTGG